MLVVREYSVSGPEIDQKESPVGGEIYNRKRVN